ncbi:pseudaminic acid cytidylyltransferase [Aequorivita viscosa]|uniref:N-acylneuraminate cytidylyltransferase n=1 Tax=Aequorivita viscosa TaxID=797419 RepID=A0A1M6FPI6_9FLAO|nr:pseudaminic acid cytidylyltransferase [Aequorivita viscosa]SDW74774.1 N-acylneuraminate cytidylyltransferase [Aequorivita viscosa]SHI99592.1 N-acylneuraminate cytidylyltransferase [Aequorivita viscosa]
MGNLCIIPARGGSKRIPRKNIRDFLGKPIIAYSIETALESGLFSEVMVSTDDEEIAEIAKRYGAKVPFFRSKETANDFATLADVVDEVFHQFESKKSFFEHACCILPTAPLMSVEDLNKGYQMLLKEDVDSVRPVVRFAYPIQRAFKMEESGKVFFLYPEFLRTRSQDLEPVYHDAGQFYWFKSVKKMLGENRYAMEISEMRVQDIDTFEDWKVAEMKFEWLKNM